MLRPTTCAWSKPKARRHHDAAVGWSATLRIVLNNALLWITTTIMTAIALGSITTAMAVVNASAQSSSSALHGQSNYRGVDAVSALTGLSNGYMQSYYHQLANAAEQQHQHQQQQQHQHSHLHSHIHPQGQQTQYHLQYHPHNTELVDKEPTGRGLQLHANYYGNGLAEEGARGGGGGAGVGGTTSQALDIFNVPDSGFIPTTLSAAGQHYASSFLGLQASQADKTNVHVPASSASKATATAIHDNNNNNNSNNIDFQQSAPVSYSNMATTTTALVGDNNGAHSLYGRLSNYDELSGRRVRSSNALATGNAAADDGGGGGGNGAGDSSSRTMHNFALAYDNYAVNLYNDHNTNEGEQQQNFVNYFTPTKTSATTTTSTIAYGSQSPHKYLPLSNYHSNEQQSQQQHYHHPQQQPEKQQIYSRAAAAAITPATTPASSTDYYDNSNHPNNIDGNKQLVTSSYQAWNVMDKPTASDNYYTTQQYTQRQYREDQQEYKEPETAESTYVVHTSGKRSKSKSKRSDPLHQVYDSYTPEHATHLKHTAEDDAETIQLQQHQLDELHEKLRQQQQQFVTLQHQLIDHDQQLQIHKHQPQYQVHQPTLPPVTHSIQHNPLSLQALAGTPLSKHTHVVRTIPVPQRQQIYVPTKENVNVEVPDPIITTVRKPLPIEVPVSRTVAIPQVNEVKIPIEKIRPFPVERPIPYIVEKRVPYTVEKQVAKPVYYHVPIKVPIVHTVVHKVHTTHPYSYYHQQKQQHPIHYTGHIRHVSHHGGYGHSHLSGGHY